MVRFLIQRTLRQTRILLGQNRLGLRSTWVSFGLQDPYSCDSAIERDRNVRLSFVRTPDSRGFPTPDLEKFIRLDSGFREIYRLECGTRMSHLFFVRFQINSNLVLPAPDSRGFPTPDLEKFIRLNCCHSLYLFLYILLAYFL